MTYMYMYTTCIYKHLFYPCIYTVHNVTNTSDTPQTKKLSCNCRTRCHSSKNCPCKAAKTSCTALCHPQRTCVNIPVPQTCAGIVEVDAEETEARSTNMWTNCGTVSLTTKHKEILESKHDWLDDSLIRAAQCLLQEQYPYIGGFQNPVLAEKLAMEPQAGEFVQIVNVQSNHWICLSTIGCKPSTINIYDSLHGHMDAHTRKLIADLLQSKHRSIEVCYANVQWQSGVNDCGLFAIAFATSICSGEDPTTITFRQEDMRSHLLSCIQTSKLTGFPPRNTRRRSKPIRKENVHVFCVCRLIDDGTPMVECSSCQEWYHFSCVNVPDHILRNKKLEWKCARCA